MDDERVLSCEEDERVVAGERWVLRSGAFPRNWSTPRVLRVRVEDWLRVLFLASLVRVERRASTRLVDVPLVAAVRVTVRPSVNAVAPVRS